MLTEQIMRSSPLSRIIVSVSMILILAIAAYNWALAPHINYLNASQQYNAMNDLLKKKSLLLRKSVSIKMKKYDKIDKQIDELNSGFFTTSQSKEFFSNLGTLAKQSGCYIEQVNFKPNSRQKAERSETDKYSLYPRSASVEFVGGYGQIIDFLNNITDIPKRFSLGELSISSDQSIEGLVCNIDVTVYIREDKDTE